MDNPTQNTNSDMSNEELKATLEQMSPEEILRVVALTLLAEKGLGDLDDETKADMVDDLVLRETSFINRSLVGALPEDKRIEFEKAVEEGKFDENTLTNALRESGINADDVVANAITKFREIYLGVDLKLEEILTQITMHLWLLLLKKRRQTRFRRIKLSKQLIRLSALVKMPQITKKWFMKATAHVVLQFCVRP